MPSHPSHPKGPTLFLRRGLSQAAQVAALFDEADVDNDFHNGSFQWGGQARALGDLTDNGDGSYDLAYGGFYADDACTVMVEYETDTPASVTGNFFSWTDGSQRYEWEGIATTSGDIIPRIYTNTPTTYAQTLSNFPGRATQVASNGIRRVLMTVANGVAPRTVTGAWPPLVHGTAFGSLNTPTKITFGRRARFNDQPLTNATLRRVTIWPRVLTDAEMQMIGEGAEAQGIHFLGDSFLNGQGVLRAMNSNMAARDLFVPLTQDNVGGDDMDDHATRYALDSVVSGNTYDISHFKDATLVILDGGISGTAQANTDAIDSIVAELNGQRWLWVEPAPQNEIGVQARTDHDALVAAVTAHITSTYGAEHIVPTYDEALAAGDGSTADNDEIAKGLWPLSLKISTVDFHPSDPAGYQFIAAQIDAKMVENGWFQALPTFFGVSSFETGTATGAQSHTSSDLAGITPSFAFIFGGNHQTANDASETSTGTIAMAMLDATSQRAISSMSQDGQANTNCRHALSSAHALRIANQTNYRKAATGSFVAGGVSLNYSLNNDNNQRLGMFALGGSGAQQKVGTLNLGTGTGPVSVTGIGFRADVVLFFGVGHDTDNTLIVDTKQHFGIALADGTQRSVAIVEDSGAAAGAPHQALLTDAAVAELNPTNGALVYKAVVSNFGADGFDVTPSANAGNDLVYYVAIKLPGRNVSLTDFSTPTATGLATIGSAGFVPEFSLAVTTNLEATDSFPGATSDLQCGYGVAAMTAGNQAATSFRIDSGAATTDTGSLCLPVALLGPSATACDANKATFDSFVEGGPRLNFTAAQGTAKEGFVLSVG